MQLMRILASSFILMGPYRARAGIVPQLWPPICYSLKDTYVGADFQNNWEWEAIPDPTHGRVNYVTLAQAQALNLTEITDDNSFIMRADLYSTVSPNATGRNSIRIESRAAYGESLSILDMRHMPWGCGTWPAFWTKSAAGPWPNGGEIDIIEGVNLNTANQATLHTTPNCTQCVLPLQTGNSLTYDCDASIDNNAGCGVQFTQPNSYGRDFNANGGGYYIMQLSRDVGIRIWFKQREDIEINLWKRDGNERLCVDLATWGLPDAAFTWDQCDYDSHFNAQNFLFDLTFCGDWAGNVYSTSGCPGNCTDFVDNNPDQFVEAFWDIKSLRVYEPCPYGSY